MASKHKKIDSWRVVHTRKLDRAVARENMKRQGLRKVCKHDHTQGYTISGKTGEITYLQSYFAKHWREFVK